jgi:hypothetical protein
MQVRVAVQLGPTLEGYRPQSGDCCQVTAGSTVLDLIAQLQIPREAVNLIFVNGAKAELTTGLRGGERVGLYPPLCGG